jgi:hypothetical protein
MTRADLKAFAADLTIISFNVDTLSQFVDDIFNELAFLSIPQFIKTEIIPLTGGTATYDFPSDALKPLAAFFNDEMLSFSSSADLNAYATTWPIDNSEPKAITLDELTARTYTLYPNPAQDSDSVIPIHGEPFGEDYPANNLVLIYADDRQSPIMTIYTLPIILEALSREFTYPSNHTDTDYADICKTLAQLLAELVK